MKEKKMSKNGTETEKARFSRFSEYKRKVHGLKEKPDEAFYSCEELAEMLKVNIMTIYRYIDKGKLEAYKIGRHYRISNDEFSRFLEDIKVSNK